MTYKILDVGFRYDAQTKTHTPTVLIGFEPNDFDARDAFAAELRSEQGQPEKRAPVYESIRDAASAVYEATVAEPQPVAEQEAPAELFDGHAVYRMLKPDAKRRTSAENVSDVLDAVVRLMNRTPSAEKRGETQGGGS